MEGPHFRCGVLGGGVGLRGGWVGGGFWGCVLGVFCFGGVFGFSWCGFLVFVGGLVVVGGPNQTHVKALELIRSRRKKKK